MLNLAAIELSTTLTSPTTPPKTIIARIIIKSQRKSSTSKDENSASKTSKTISSSNKTKTAMLTNRMRSKMGPTLCKLTMLMSM